MQPPMTVVRAVQLVWVLVVAAAVITIVSVVFDHDLVATWGDHGVSADDTRVPPTFAPVAIVLFVVVAALMLVLMALFRDGHDWARHSLGAGVVLVVIATVSVVRTGPPTLFVVLALVTMALEIALLVCLYAPSTNAFFARRGTRADVEI